MSQPVCDHGTAAPETCDASCQCCCDACQERYEAGWARQVAEKNLCALCGIPKGELTFERLEEFKYVHFYQACDDCHPLVCAFLQKEKRCCACRTPLKGDGSCSFCSQYVQELEEDCGCTR